MPRASRSRIQLSDEEKKKRRREQKKLSIRRARAKLSTEDLEERRRKDRERYKKKKEEGKIKTIKDMTPREQRNMRKIWREKAKVKRSREKMKKTAISFTVNNTPPSSPSVSRVSSGRAVATRNRRILKIENSYLKSKINKLESQVAKYRMRCIRTNQKLSEIIKTPKKIKYKKNKNTELKMAIQNFLIQDECSRLTSGKNETITRKKVKMQIRYLNDSLLNLHKAFVNNLKKNVSYETFRVHRPFWVLFPKVQLRDTCLCALHTNYNLMIRALHTSKIIAYSSATDMIKSLCCNKELNVICLERRCPHCKNYSITTKYYEDKDTISYDRWITKNVNVVIKGQAKLCKKTIKERVNTTKGLLIEKLNLNLPTFMQHVANLIHQNKAIQSIKQSISPSDGLLHIDFSENYNCKYSQEIQSAHFGGSKPQITLHTSVYYSTDSEPPENYVTATSTCTVSENLRHDPVLITIHLKALIKRIMELSPHLKHLHILSDGPVTQYRNKLMFHLMATYISKEFGVDTVSWHFSEKGHGKGAPDGVGGCVKRTADNYVARGNDIIDLDGLIECLRLNCKGIEVYKIDETLIPQIQKIAAKSATRPFKGTLSIHQLTWCIDEPNLVHARRLSCLTCAAHVKCPHYEIGQINIQFVQIKQKMKVVTPESSKSQPNSLHSTEAHMSNPSVEIHSLKSADINVNNLTPESHAEPGTPDASTSSVSPNFLDRLTPNDPIDASEQLGRPKKRPRKMYTDNSDLSSSERSIKRLPRIDFVDFDDEYNIF